MHIITVVKENRVVEVRSHPLPEVMAAAVDQASTLKGGSLNLYERDQLTDNWELELKTGVVVQIHRVESDKQNSHEG